MVLGLDSAGPDKTAAIPDFPISRSGRQLQGLPSCKCVVLKMSSLYAYNQNMTTRLVKTSLIVVSNIHETLVGLFEGTDLGNIRELFRNLKEND